MAKYNILYLHNKSEISGGERSLLSLWENLDRQTFTPFLMVPAEGDFSRQASQMGVKVISRPFPRIHPWNIMTISRTLAFLRKILIREKIDLIHSYTARNNMLASMIGRCMRIPVIWHERNVLMKGERDITQLFLFLPDAIICNSMAVAIRLGPLPAKVRIILNGVDLGKFTPLPADAGLKKKYHCEHHQIVGIVTNLTLRRRAEYFIEMAKSVHAQIPKTSFFIVGGEFEEASRGRLKELEALRHREGLEDFLFFAGRQDDVRPWIALFDVCCHVTPQDACSRSVLEAMAMGRAVVAMNDGGNPELIENAKSGILVGADDQDSFVKGVVDLLNNEEHRKQLGQAARQRAEKLFDVARNTKETQGLYLDLIKKRSLS